MKKIWISVIAIVAAAAVLFALNLGLDGIAKKNEEKSLQLALTTLLPGSTNFTEEVYEGEDANIVRAWKGETGFVVETNTYGYAGEITMLVGVSNEGKVLGLTVKDMHETYGLGARALKDWLFLAHFLETSGDVSIAAEGVDSFSSATGASAEGGAEVDAITGATVTSKAIARSVNSAVGYVTGADASSSATTWGG